MMLAEIPAAGASVKDYLGLIMGAVGTVFGGAGLKFIDNRYSARQKKADIEIRLHDELREEAKELKSAIARLQAHIDQQQQAYYNVLIKYNMLRERSKMPMDLDNPVLEERIRRVITEVKKQVITDAMET